MKPVENLEGETRIVGRHRRLPTPARMVFDEIFQSGGGYLLDFTDRTMAEWFEETFNLDIFQARFQVEGTSKGKTLRGFVEVAEPRLVARVLRALWSYRCRLDVNRAADPAAERRLEAWLNQFAAELDALSSLPLEAAIRDFSGDTTLSKLRASIEGDLIGERPDVALDRVHTYCVKRFRHLLREHGRLIETSWPLDALFGAYGKMLKEAGSVSEIILPMLRVQHRVFEGLNQARNKRSLAHDNPLLESSEAQFMIDCVLASLAFVERLEAGQRAVTTIHPAADDIPF